MSPVKRRPSPRRSAKFTPERASEILAEAAVVGDAATAKRWGISKRTLWRYRARAKADSALTAQVNEKKGLLAKTGWAANLGDTLRTVIDSIKARTEKGEPNYRELVGAAKVLGELETVRKALDGEQPADPRQGAEPATHAREGEQPAEPTPVH